EIEPRAPSILSESSNSRSKWSMLVARSRARALEEKSDHKPPRDVRAIDADPIALVARREDALGAHARPDHEALRRTLRPVVIDEDAERARIQILAGDRRAGGGGAHLGAAKLRPSGR